MSGFTSGTHHSDPEPYVSNAPDFDRGSADDLEEWQPRHGVTFLPRPEFDYHNPVLVWFRAVADDPTLRAQYGAALVPTLARDFLLPRFIRPGDYAPEHIAHALRVLAKLAALHS